MTKCGLQRCRKEANASGFCCYDCKKQHGNVSVYLDSKVHEELKRMAAETRYPISELARRCVTLGLPAVRSIMADGEVRP